MFAITYLPFSPNVVAGSLIMYLALLSLCIYAYIKRSSIDRNPSLYHTGLVAVFGLLNSILLLIATGLNSEYTNGVLPAGLFFGLTLTPLTWMAGIALFSSIDTDKVPILVKVGYAVTFVQVVLMVIVIAFITKFVNIGNEGDSAGLIASNTYITTASINWVFFLLFVLLVIYYRHDVPVNVFRSLIVFGVLNTVRLITETAFLVQGGDLSISAFLYILFFFTDFVSTISLCVGVFYWIDLDDD